MTLFGNQTKINLVKQILEDYSLPKLCCAKHEVHFDITWSSVDRIFSALFLIAQKGQK